MKVKPVYIYVALFFIALVSIIIFSYSTTSNENEMPKDEFHGNVDNMPNDDIHRGKGSMGSSDLKPEYFKTLDSLKIVYNKNPKDSAAALMLARYQIAGHKNAEALAIYDKLAKDYHKSVKVLQEAAYMYFQTGKYDIAENYVRLAIKADPKFASSYFNLGIIYVSKGDSLKAKQTWEKMITDFPNAPEVKIARTALEDLKNPKKGEK
jgi:tetratricopeptide (TPR) repeat protein